MGNEAGMFQKTEGLQKCAAINESVRREDRFVPGTTVKAVQDRPSLDRKGASKILKNLRTNPRCC
jgi:hypothetical protein